MGKVTLKAQVKALETAIGKGGPGIWREGYHEVHRKQLEAALQTLKCLDQLNDFTRVLFGAAKP